MRAMSKAIASAACAALLASSTATASASVPVAPAAQPPAPNAWMMLSVLGPTQSVALGGATAAAQSADVPPPPPPAAYGFAGGTAVNGELIPFILWFGLIPIALTISNGAGGSATAPTP